jgi:hypothetical protein
MQHPPTATPMKTKISAPMDDELARFVDALLGITRSDKLELIDRDYRRAWLDAQLRRELLAAQGEPADDVEDRAWRIGRGGPSWRRRCGNRSGARHNPARRNLDRGAGRRHQAAASAGAEHRRHQRLVPGRHARTHHQQGGAAASRNRRSGRRHGPRVASFAKCTSVGPVHKARVKQRIGRIPVTTLRTIEACVARVLGLPA